MIGVFLCAVVWVSDGDTLRCRGGPAVRLAGIGAAELGAPGGRESRAALIRVARGRTLRCRAVGRSYHRVVAWCSLGRRDVSCQLVASGAAVRWPRYWQGWRCRS